MLTADQQTTLANYIKALPSLQGLRDSAAEDDTQRRTVAQEFVDFYESAKGLKKDDPVIRDGTVVGEEHYRQVKNFLASDPAETVQYAVAHTLYNLLAGTPVIDATPAVYTTDKLELMNAVPAFLDAEVAWRVAAVSNPALATALVYWDRATSVNPMDALASKILDALEAAHIITPDIRAEVIAACTKTVPKKSASSVFEERGIPGVMPEDILVALVGA